MGLGAGLRLQSGLEMQDSHPSSREINSFENVRPGIRPRFLSQKIEQKEPEKKIPWQ